LGIETTTDKNLIKLVSVLNHEDSYIETHIEREFVDTLEGGCQVPIGVNAKIIDDKIEIKAMLGLPNGKEYLKEKVIINKSDYKNSGKDLAMVMIKQGAKELLAEAEKIAFK
jgi:hydroxymethylbilane synthase